MPPFDPRTNCSHNVNYREIFSQLSEIFRDKSNFCIKLITIYVLVFVFYCSLSITGSFAFPFVQDIYTLNFYHDEQTGSLMWYVVDYFLALFPVFTLTSSYIIVAITLTNNIRALISMNLTRFYLISIFIY